MTADARMIFVSRSGAEARELKVPPFFVTTWCGHLPTKIPWRTADAGPGLLSEVFVCSHAEATAATAATREEVGRGKSITFDPIMLRACDDIEKLLAWIGTPQHYSSWILIETADID